MQSIQGRWEYQFKEFNKGKICKLQEVGVTFKKITPKCKHYLKKVIEAN